MSFYLIVYETEMNWPCVCAAMRIQLSDDIYDHLVKCEPKYIINKRGLRNVLVSIQNNVIVM